MKMFESLVGTFTSMSSYMDKINDPHGEREKNNNYIWTNANSPLSW